MNIQTDTSDCVDLISPYIVGGMSVQHGGKEKDGII